MANSTTVTAGSQATAAQYNNLRLDVLSTTTGHTHDGTDSAFPAIGPFGDGSDGSVTITSNSFSSGPITSNVLTRDAFFTDLTLNASVNLDTAQFRLFVSGTLTIGSSARLNCNGSAGGDGTATTYGLGASQPSGSVGGGTYIFGRGQGGNGGMTNSGTAKGGGGGGAGGGVLIISAKSIINNGFIEANGGTGGSGWAGTGGSGGTSTLSNGAYIFNGLGGAGAAGGNSTANGSGGGTVTTPPATYGATYRTGLAVLGRLVYQESNATNSSLVPICGGGGGGGGGYGSAGGNGAVGGGGGGGLVIIIYRKATWGTEQALGGANGPTGVTTGAGTATAGTVVKVQV